MIRYLFAAVMLISTPASASLFSITAASPTDIDLDGDGFTDFRFVAESNPALGNYFRVESPLYLPTPITPGGFPPQPIIPLPTDANFPVGAFDLDTTYTYNTLGVTLGDDTRVQAFDQGVTLSADVNTAGAFADAGVPSLTSAQDFVAAGNMTGDFGGNGGLIIPSDFSSADHYFAGAFFARLDNSSGPTIEMVVFNVSFSPSGDQMNINGISTLAGTTITIPEPSTLVLLAVGLASLIGWRRRYPERSVPTLLNGW
ncbi:MAG TPA: PEP-CTERM sorting domain-containing protein [Pirellulales bacterium]|nr:PEP-CTERM sorting domain-containing protein [Pirellulales bacterium]